jgi:hypothetical protein
VRRVVLLLPVLLVSGCGQSDDRAAVRRVTERFVTAFAQSQGDVACAALSEDTRAELVSQEGEACATAVGSLDLEGGKVTRVVVEVTSALVVLSSGERVYLGKTANGWRLSAVGCLPKDGPPDRYPMDCELSA